MRTDTEGLTAQRLARAARGGSAQQPAQPDGAPNSDILARNSALISRFFIDLRLSQRLTPEAAAQYLHATPQTIYALEAARFDLLPPWPEVVRIVTGYSAFANVDGAPALAMIADTIVAISAAQAEAIQAAQSIPKTEPPRPRPNFAGAFKLPQKALRGARARPDRAFYALSLPLVLLMLTFNSSAMASALTSVSDYFRVHFAEVREGLRWIEVSDPRSRRGDLLETRKLQLGQR